ncbi:MAG: hypothetical protein AAGF73_04365 [Actinomycetota bacterium]
MTNGQRDSFSILLDQGFPKPTQFAISELDRTVTVEHLAEFAPELASRSTPDWYVYCAAAESGFDALVVRDRSQLDQLAEMFVLDRLKSLTIVTWRKGIDDPIREWGQLLAYLPQVKRRATESGGRALLLPAPTLSNDSYVNPRDQIGVTARDLRVSAAEVRRMAQEEIEGWLLANEEPPDRFATLLA